MATLKEQKLYNTIQKEVSASTMDLIDDLIDEVRSPKGGEEELYNFVLDFKGCEEIHADEIYAHSIEEARTKILRELDNGLSIIKVKT